MRDFLKKYDIFGWSMAVFAAILLWMYVITIQNPEITVNRVITLQTVGANELSRSNLTIISDIPQTVTLQLRGNKKSICIVFSRNYLYIPFILHLR